MSDGARRRRESRSWLGVDEWVMVMFRHVYAFWEDLEGLDGWQMMASYKALLLMMPECKTISIHIDGGTSV